MKKSFLLTAVCFIIFGIMLRYSHETVQGARYGLLLWYQSIVPALFPFMVLSSFIISCGGVSYFMMPVWLGLRRLMPISKEGCYVLFTGLLCGFPMGAKTCSDFVFNHRISMREGKFLMTVCNVPSPMFLLGFVYPFFKDYISSGLFLSSIYLPLLPLIFLSYQYHYKFQEFSADDQKSFCQKEAAVLSIDDAILDAAELLCKIGGYLVLFSITIQWLKRMEWIPIKIRLSIIGLLEMTTGVRELTHALSFPSAWIAVSSILAFGGFSGMFQVHAVLSSSNSNAGKKQIRHEKKTGLSIRSYFFWKIIQVCITALWTWVLCNYAS